MLGSFGFADFMCVRPGCRRVHTGSLYKFGCALVVFGFIQGSLGSSRFTLLVIGFICDRSVNLGSPLTTSGSFSVVAFIRVHPVCRWVHSSVPWGSSGSFGIVGYIRVHPEGRSLSSFGVVRYIRVPPGCRRVHSGSLGTSRCTLGIMGSFAVVAFIQMRHWGRRVVCGSLCLFVCVLGVVVLIQGRWEHSGGPWLSSGSFGLADFIRVRPECLWVYSVSLGSFQCALGGRRINAGTLDSFV